MNLEPFDPYAQLELEKKAISTFVEREYPNAIEDTTGIWYEMLETADSATFAYKFNQNGSRIFPSATVNYRLKLLNGTEVDANQSTAGIEFSLNNLIPAWQIAFFPRAVGNQTHLGLTTNGLQPGDVMRIITPSFYAYGNQNRPGLPANSPLIFEIKVLKIVD
ncbi:FKBP-type peptidyl-prolyl cis-trans isomerase [Sphingobacterium sp. lm-10]|uniref:FKBP-type peptidyl-prolyl cis-trans isomerase n=1 Tax=Sphingobacterium sp. lm-10 TaxID=2944904 RepID=UPI0020226324|nr:FKBP-type peptidyl-prolyl cis-trans isomerase [Sphingobacterium sp. lm-10]MCL7988965.1 FKBP-type peptidyl-prolyl cis-trans isomerase [Sphingobacterium sp. lm-10]